MNIVIFGANGMLGHALQQVFPDAHFFGRRDAFWAGHPGAESEQIHGDKSLGLHWLRHRKDQLVYD
jgi:hypothetical protein